MFRIVQNESILLLKSLSERDGYDIERLRICMTSSAIVFFIQFHRVVVTGQSINSKLTRKWSKFTSAKKQLASVLMKRLLRYSEI